MATRVTIEGSPIELGVLFCEIYLSCQLRAEIGGVLAAGVNFAGIDTPSDHGQRPLVVATIDINDLITRTGAATLIDRGPDEVRLSAGDTRRLACAAGVLPAVMDGASAPLDVGREHRLATPAITRAIWLRDRGCAFPGCDAIPAACHVHHITPWHTGGTTNLDNLVLLCPHHHRLVEPDPPSNPNTPSHTGPAEPGNRTASPNSSPPQTPTTPNGKSASTPQPGYPNSYPPPRSTTPEHPATTTDTPTHSH